MVCTLDISSFVHPGAGPGANLRLLLACISKSRVGLHPIAKVGRII
jgi:hypothetical protein